jgi:hypothetical protein
MLKPSKDAASGFVPSYVKKEHPTSETLRPSLGQREESINNSKAP